MHKHTRTHTHTRTCSKRQVLRTASFCLLVQSLEGGGRGRERVRAGVCASLRCGAFMRLKVSLAKFLSQSHLGSFFLPSSPPLSLSLFLKHTHKHTHSHFISLIHTLSLYLSLSLSVGVWSILCIRQTKSNFYLYPYTLETLFCF